MVWGYKSRGGDIVLTRGNFMASLHVFVLAFCALFYGTVCFSFAPSRHLLGPSSPKRWTSVLSMATTRADLRNVAIIAHVDHGKV